MVNKQSTAILLFSRTAEKEVAAKTFYSGIGKSGNISIVKKLISQSTSIANKTGLPLFSCYSPQQIGNSFGERLANAIESIFAKKYENVIVIGNDCPSLTQKSILDVEKLLLENDLLLGPDTNGGVYLIGIKKEAYCRQNFIELAWESKQLQESWGDYATGSKSDINWLKNRSDINSPTDFNDFLITCSQNNLLRKQLISIISSFKKTKTVVIPSFYLLHCRANLALRAPPYCHST